MSARPRFGARVASLFLTASLGLAPTVHASTSYWDYLQVCVGAGHLTCTGDWTQTEESTTIAASWVNYKSKSSQSSIGQARANGQAPHLTAVAGTNVTLTFRFISPVTELPAAGPAVHHVLYRANLDHTNPASFVDIGTSSTPLNGFALDYTIVGCEPIIEAIPYNASNVEVVLPGPGENVARGAVALLRPDAAPGLDPRGLMALGALLLASGAVALSRRRESAGHSG